MAHQNGGGNALAAGIHHGFDHRLVVGGSYGDDAGPAAAGGGNNAINGMYHTFSSCVAQILRLCKAKQYDFGPYDGIIIHRHTHRVNNKLNDSAK